MPVITGLSWYMGASFAKTKVEILNKENTTMG